MLAKARAVHAKVARGPRGEGRRERIGSALFIEEAAYRVSGAS
jgi:hypothetical protein